MASLLPLCRGWLNALGARRRWAPRRLHFTRTGKWLVALALLIGLAALNTGNNLLLLGWSMVLCAIVLSGVLSEACLRSLDCTVDAPPLWRVGEKATVSLLISNRARQLPAFAVALSATWKTASTAKGTLELHAPYVLRLLPEETRLLYADAQPTQRGIFIQDELRATTAYPFGFFVKIRPLDHPPRQIVCAPRRVSVTAALATLLGGPGESPQNVPGQSDTLLTLRPFRHGDEQRRIDWRKSLTQKMPLVRETERLGGRAVMVELQLLASATADEREEALARLGSLHEALIERGFEAGLLAPGLCVLPSSGASFVSHCLAALGAMQTHLPTPKAPESARALSWLHLGGPGLAASKQPASHRVAP